MLTARSTDANSDGLYWRYETFIKICEGRLGALLGSNGAIYSIRTSVFPRIAECTIVDDFVIPLLARLRSGCRIVYESDAVAREEIPPTVRDEFRRRTRIGSGGYQAVGLLWRLLDPRQGWISLSFFSHKVLRWFSPFALLFMLLACMILRDTSPFRLLFWAQLLFYLGSTVMMIAPGSIRVPRVLRLAGMFTGMNLALLVGIVRAAGGRQDGRWRRTVRTGELIEPSA
jgi:cellulose synthase/poly-beta-1,6-N-acetylglucosamine synthase-like glycosyltransferase